MSDAVYAGVVLAGCTLLIWVVARSFGARKKATAVRVGDKVTARGVVTTGVVRGITKYASDGRVTVWVTPEGGFVGADLADVEPDSPYASDLEEVEVKR